MKKNYAKKGNAYKYKTKKFFIENGYECEYTEKVQYFKKGPSSPMIFLKKDLFGSDGIAMNEKEIIFWNSKCLFESDLEPSKLDSICADTVKDFAKHKIPNLPFVSMKLVLWQPRKKPLFVDLTSEVYEAKKQL